mmetsp:Transcript_16187/g.25067  ORF Transcript_16187/g.25067 Transcript_16187/m.25067 type:complete len:107 (-) Transcript_16187:259-579(-)|eukprot:CAMPEP_0170510482 /NCGR_PEP_ID=MMETSP0208-20121228/65791_1 /TAXON_ID=197538 /ORGANISM="Strombidium inclinatum, Strain S3" /LENGTH=106 /DNA_ID=CAMNT_0010793947 /DNA_START=856 /DNA_END=1176 /DNA_ORIENTATION=-
MAHFNSYFGKVDLEGLKNVRVFLTQGEINVYRRDLESQKPEDPVSEVEEKKKSLAWILASQFGKTQSLLIVTTALNMFIYYLNSYAIQKVQGSDDEGGSASSIYFY